MDNETLLEIATQMEYDFDDIRILRQAFTRKSYSEEHNGEHHNEELEFYGQGTRICCDEEVIRVLREYHAKR